MSERNIVYEYNDTQLQYSNIKQQSNFLSDIFTCRGITCIHSLMLPANLLRVTFHISRVSTSLYNDENIKEQKEYELMSFLCKYLTVRITNKPRWKV